MDDHDKLIPTMGKRTSTFAFGKLPRAYPCSISGHKRGQWLRGNSLSVVKANFGVPLAWAKLRLAAGPLMDLITGGQP